jgi:iron complex transport system permease protein
MYVPSFYTIHDYFRSIKMGASFLVLADTASRTVFGATEIPVGLITALLGGPFFFMVLRRQMRD